MSPAKMIIETLPLLFSLGTSAHRAPGDMTLSLPDDHVVAREGYVANGLAYEKVVFFGDCSLRALTTDIPSDVLLANTAPERTLWHNANRYLYRGEAELVISKRPRSIRITRLSPTRAQTKFQIETPPPRSALDIIRQHRAEAATYEVTATLITSHEAFAFITLACQQNSPFAQETASIIESATVAEASPRIDFFAGTEIHGISFHMPENTVIMGTRELEVAFEGSSGHYATTLITALGVPAHLEETDRGTLLEANFVELANGGPVESRMLRRDFERVAERIKSNDQQALQLFGQSACYNLENELLTAEEWSGIPLVYYLREYRPTRADYDAIFFISAIVARDYRAANLTGMGADRAKIDAILKGAITTMTTDSAASISTAASSVVVILALGALVLLGRRQKKNAIGLRTPADRGPLFVATRLVTASTVAVAEPAAPHTSSPSASSATSPPAGAPGNAPNLETPVRYPEKTTLDIRHSRRFSPREWLFVALGVLGVIAIATNVSVDGPGSDEPRVMKPPRVTHPGSCSRDELTWERTDQARPLP